MRDRSPGRKQVASVELEIEPADDDGDGSRLASLDYNGHGAPIEEAQDLLHCAEEIERRKVDTAGKPADLIEFPLEV